MSKCINELEEEIIKLKDTIYALQSRINELEQSQFVPPILLPSNPILNDTFNPYVHMSTTTPPKFYSALQSSPPTLK